MNGKNFYALFQEYWNETHDPDERISKLKAEDICRSVLDVLGETINGLEVGDRVAFYGFGSFSKKLKPAHVIGDLKTGGRIEVPEKEKIVFTRSATK